MADKEIMDAYIQVDIFTDQTYIREKTHRDSTQSDKVKTSNKWKSTQPQGYTFEGTTVDKFPLKSQEATQGKRTVFTFGGSSLTERWSVHSRGDTRNIPLKNKKKTRKPRKPDRYLVRDKKLRAEKLKQIQNKMNGRKQQ